jgi:hypothetical protein
MPELLEKLNNGTTPEELDGTRLMKQVNGNEIWGFPADRVGLDVAKRLAGTSQWIGV